MKFIKFLLSSPFYIGYFAVMLIIIIGISINPDIIISAPLIPQIMVSIAVLGGSITCGIQMISDYKAYLNL